MSEKPELTVIEGSLDPARSVANKVLARAMALGEAVDEAAKHGVVCTLWVGKASIDLKPDKAFEISAVVNL